MAVDSASETVDKNPLVGGVEVIKRFLATLPATPGVYRMLNSRGDPLYVGKAKSLKKRVVAYTHPERLPLRLQRMIATTASMEVVTTHTEAEALLLESNLIKQLKPRYNILLRDDKSFPWLVITAGHDFPQVVKHRGSRDLKGEYFGPFASAGAVNDTLDLIEKAFLLRSCADSVFHSRTRPCLLYQIKRCSAPCTGKIDRESYAALVAEARAFLTGQSRDLATRLVARMEAYAEAMEYEQAGVLRDRLKALARILAHQDISLEGVLDADVIAGHQAGGQTCIQVFFYRLGQNYGNRAYFPIHTAEAPLAEVMEAFIGQFYANKLPPPVILLSEAIPNPTLIADALSLRAGNKVRVQVPKRGDKSQAVLNATTNAREALGRRLAENAAHGSLLEGVAEVFDLASPPQRVEVYDNSHIQGSHAVGGMIVVGPSGFDKASYRKFNIKDSRITPGDDYGMMREVLTRRFTRTLDANPDNDRERTDKDAQWPDLVLIDGGKGQLSVAMEVLASLGITHVPLVGIAKGPDRNAGKEVYTLPGREPFTLPHNHPVHYFLQRVRDEAHRFAIGSHRDRRSRAIGESPLDGLGGIGPRRKRALLNTFGSARGVSEAGIKDLQAVEGISPAMAQKIYQHFHPAPFPAGGARG